MLRVFVSGNAEERLRAAGDFVRRFAAGTEIILVGPSHHAVDDFARALAAENGATFGLHRFTPLALAARIAAADLARGGMAPASSLAIEAVAVRISAAACRDGLLAYFGPVASSPGFGRALASTLSELRLAEVDPDSLLPLAAPGRDLALLLSLYTAQLAEASLADRAAVLAAAAAAAEKAGPPCGAPLVLLDVALDSRLEARFLGALAAAAPDALATTPLGDHRARDFLAMCDGVTDLDPPAAEMRSSLSRLQKYLFSDATPPPEDAGEEVSFFSAPGEGRECVEIARRILDEARNGIPFDDMAVLLRSPETYGGLLEAALRRAGIPAFFARGTKRPDPAGRAFLALLACASENLSAARFAEYLSLGQVPDLARDGTPKAAREQWTPSDDELLAATTPPSAVADSVAVQESATPAPLESDESPARAGTLRAPWRWERLLGEAAVIGGRDRWVRRIEGLEAELRLKRAAAERDDPDSARRAALERDLADLDSARRFILPLIEELAALPQGSDWAGWLSRLEKLAPKALRRPERVLRLLAALRPMGSVGPIALDEVREVLTERLSTLEQDAPARRYGRVFVAAPGEARGHRFAVVFVPGLAERIFPQRPREDPLLLDAARRKLERGLRTREDRSQQERLLLRIATGAAGRCLYVSYPRLELGQSRPRVPSFYGLDVARATRGSIPDYEALERQAVRAAQARLAWPAPPDPASAIDEAEHDLAVLDRLLHDARAETPKGRARYLLDLNPHLARSLRARWARWERRRWSAPDGLIDVTSDTAREALAAQRLTARPYAVSALQRFARCPYQFLLAAVHGLQRRDEPASPERLDPATRGQIFHAVQATGLRELEKNHLLPLSPADLRTAQCILDAVTDKIAAAYAEQLAPAIPRIWEDAVQGMRADLHAWLSLLAKAADDWEPIHFEYGFGMPPSADLDPHSTPDPVTVAGGFLLRGAVDLVERRRASGDLRVTDHKTGENNTSPRLVIGGGEVLQPILYGLAVEAATKLRVVETRLSFCTAKGRFSERVVPTNERVRETAGRILGVIDGAIRRGFLPPAPRNGACDHCDFGVVCGPYEETRAAGKEQRPLAELRWLRGLA